MKHKKTYKNIHKNRENKFYGNNTKFFTSKMRP